MQHRQSFVHADQSYGLPLQFLIYVQIANRPQGNAPDCLAVLSPNYVYYDM